MFAECQAVFESWRAAGVDDFDFDDPKGFSSFTMGVRARAGRADLDPDAVLYRRLAGKENAILDFDAERTVFLALGEAGIAARCYHYDRYCRIEQFYRGRTLTADDVFDPVIARGVADELYRFHRLDQLGYIDLADLPKATYFELLFDKWGPLARRVLVDQRHLFPDHEAALCDELLGLLDPITLERAMACVGDRSPTFCHNDTYHGNVFLCDDTAVTGRSRVKLLDFEFSCLNTPVFDFANFFAETVMVHGLADPPHFTIAEPRFDDTDLARFVGYYLDNDPDLTGDARAVEVESMVADTQRALMLSDLMYSMAALPLAVQPIQEIRFLPYSAARFAKFNRTWEQHFGC